MTAQKRNLVRELNHASPANMHASLGDTLEALILAHNAEAVASPTKISLGSPIAPDTDNLVKAATGTELPNAETVTYTGATDNVSPLDGVLAAPGNIVMADGNAHLVYTLDVPRNITYTVAHGSAVVAMDVTIVGFDYKKQPMTEKTTLGAGGTSQTGAGKKAFKYIKSIAIHAAADAEANTLDIGIGDVLGLPSILAEKSDLLQTWFNDVLEATAPTVVVADTATVTETTGDPRGTVDLNSASNGSAIKVWMNAGAGYANTARIVPLSER
jgi:hypothetical protein